MLTKTAFLPESLFQIYLRLSAFRPKHRHYVEATVDIPNRKDLAINAGSSRYLSLLSAIYSSNYRCEVLRTACLYFDETKYVAIKRNKIDFARYLYAFIITPYGCLEIGDYQAIALPRQKSGR